MEMVNDSKLKQSETSLNLHYLLHQRKIGKPFKPEFIKNRLSNDFEIIKLKIEPKSGYVDNVYIRPKDKKYGLFNDSILEIHWFGPFTDEPQDPEIDFRRFLIYFQDDTQDPKREKFRREYIARVAELLDLLIDEGYVRLATRTDMLPERFRNLTSKMAWQEKIIDKILRIFRSNITWPIMGTPATLRSDIFVAFIFSALIIFSYVFNIFALKIITGILILLATYINRRNTITFLGWFLIVFFYVLIFMFRQSPNLEGILKFSTDGIFFLIIYGIIHLMLYNLKSRGGKRKDFLENNNIHGSTKDFFRNYKVLTVKGVVSYILIFILFMLASSFAKLLSNS